MTTELVLLVGGRSTEHDASLHSYHRVRAAVEAAPGRLSLAAVLYLTRQGEVRYFGHGPWPRAEEELSAGEELPVYEGLRRLRESGAFVFSLLHGNEGEDGSWQGVAEVLGLRGNFGPVLASALGMDKRLQAVVAAGLVPGLRTPSCWPAPRSATGSPAALREWAAAVAAELAGRPAVVKPNRMGASLLTELVREPDGAALAGAIAEVLPYDDQVLVQEFVDGTEFTCGVIRTEAGAVALPVVEAVTAGGFLGHREKHASGLVRPLLHTRDTADTRRVKEASVRIFEEMRVFGFARLDFLVRDGELYFLELNTLPGLMDGSAFPMMLEAAGFGLVELIEGCVAEHGRLPVRDKVLPYHIDHGSPAPRREVSTEEGPVPDEAAETLIVFPNRAQLATVAEAAAASGVPLTVVLPDGSAPSEVAGVRVLTAAEVAARPAPPPGARVMCCHESGVYWVAEHRAAVGTPNFAEVCLEMLVKTKLAAVLGELGVTVVAKHKLDLVDDRAALPYPAVVKPDFGFASMLVKRVADAGGLAEYERSYRQLRERSLLAEYDRFLAGYPDADPSGIVLEPDLSGDTLFLTVPFLVRAGELAGFFPVRGLAQRRDELTDFHWCAFGTGGVPPEAEAALDRDLRLIAKGLRLTGGVYEIEALWEERTATLHVLEFSPRVTGGLIPELVRRSTGVDVELLGLLYFLGVDAGPGVVTGPDRDEPHVLALLGEGDEPPELLRGATPVVSRLRRLGDSEFRDVIYPAPPAREVPR
ncbi:ATP-grasp domain-containing protein [Amycolatopsis sp. NPDC051102]|uniref:ATP-grasp domain-containing protein n=1 Tax=Amycolatopsis sp. NPDC051102 TaxID=3155163 RepID=UPI003425C7C6